jgi:predicted AlkP superfamily pyrophosphatase or phosphodiesterase
MSNQPKVIVLSLDGSTYSLVKNYLDTNQLDPTKGLGLLKSKGVFLPNTTVTPSLTAPGHIAIATGSSAANNDINANSFHLIDSPFNSNISGFGAPIGGYDALNPDGPKESLNPTAEPLWLNLRASGKTVVAATFPGADGVDVKVPGLTNSPVIQSKDDRTVDYTVPFGAFAGVGAEGFTLSKADFSDAPTATVTQLAAAGKTTYSPVLQKTTSLSKFTVGGVNYDIQVAALDTTNDNTVNYDTIAFFDKTLGIQSGPFSLPSTGSAYVKASDKVSQPFYLEGSANKAGLGFYVSNLAPDLSSVRIARYSANSIPLPAESPSVIANANDINNNVGFWAPQADFRIPEKLSPGFTNFPDSELEAIYEDQVNSFVEYQTNVLLRSIQQNPNADLVLGYIEQPDGSEHQFLITDPRQATDPTNPNSILGGQDPAKIQRYKDYTLNAYKVADDAVQKVIDTVGVDADGRPNSDIIVVSDHGFAPFHTAVSINNLLKNSGDADLSDPTKVRAVSSGPAVNIYINVKGREPNGTVDPADYLKIQQKVTVLLQGLQDSNPNYAPNGTASVFDKVYTRPVPANPTATDIIKATNEFIGQDSGDVFALLSLGYNFDGTQATPVKRLGDDPAAAAPVFSVPNFYGAHGYDPTLPQMQAIFFAAGPDFDPNSITQTSINNIDIAPTVEKILGVQPAATVQGKPLAGIKSANEPALIPVGTLGDDNLFAAPGTPFDGQKDIIFTGAGNDSVDLVTVAALPNRGNNRINTGSGADTIFANKNDRLFGVADNDTFDATDSQGGNRMSGGAGDDIFFLGKGDRALGGDGNDKFYVQSGGNNLLSGGAGNDQFWLANAEVPSSPNTVLDFQVGTDVIGFSGAASLGISATTLKLSQVGADTNILFGSQTLAVLSGIQATDLSLINSSQFVFA